MNELNKNKEELNINNIGVLYFTVKEAEQLAGVSSQTLYSYSNKGIINMHKLTGRNQNYIHLEDIELVKKMVQENKSTTRNAGAIILNKEIAIEEDSKEIKLLEEKILDLKKENEELKKVIKEKDESFRQEQKSRIEALSTIADLKEELGKLKEVDKLANALKETVNNLKNEKENMYKEQINTLITHNTELSNNNKELMTKFDRFIDSQQAFQIMLAQKEESIKVIEDKNKSFISKIFKKK